MDEEELTHYEQSIAYMKGQVAERKRILAILNEMRNKLDSPNEKQSNLTISVAIEIIEGKW